MEEGQYGGGKEGDCVEYSCEEEDVVAGLINILIFIHLIPDIVCPAKHIHETRNVDNEREEHLFEWLIVRFANAVVQPCTMMIKLVHALVARHAVLRRDVDVDFAHLAKILIFLLFIFVEVFALFYQ